MPNRRSNFVYGVLARVDPGKTVAEATRQMELVARRLELEFPDSNERLGVRVVPLLEEAAGMMRRPLLVLLGVGPQERVTLKFQQGVNSEPGLIFKGFC